MRRALPVTLLAIVAFSVTCAARADVVTVAAASNFSAPLAEIAGRFERESGHRLRIVVGATGALYAQIVNGAPFDVFLAADTERPQALVDGGLARVRDRRTYAIGALVLWTRDGQARIDGLDALQQDVCRGRFAIANPRLAPYGRAAEQALSGAGFGRDFEARRVLGENVMKAFMYAGIGNVRCALVARSLIWRDGAFRSGSGWTVPADQHAPIRQDAVLLARAVDRPAARAFFDYLGGAEAAAVLERFGYRAR